MLNEFGLSGQRTYLSGQNGNDNIEVVYNHLLHLHFPFHSTMSSGMCKFCTCAFFFQFTLVIYIAYMTANYCSVFLKQLSQDKEAKRTASGISLLVDLAIDFLVRG